ncbi:MAG: ABC-F family ATP-binding cassette domain-containing protein [Alistipes sp.]|nr:ABC-F family ATP-binding cassette domain-containing protein [Alistipes sp.]
MALSYLQVESLSKSFGDLQLFDRLTLSVDENQRIGLIARNGTGKSTLLDMIVGKEPYEQGRITFRRDLKIAYLEQNPHFPIGSTVLKACLQGDTPVLRAITAYETALESGEGDALHRAMAEMDVHQAWNYESRIKQILTELKITNFTQPTEQLSGGQIKRIALANALICEPELLILDEPTNHLDMEMTLWLEEYLSHTRLALLMVTHDRYFLDRVCSDIYEISDQKIYTYTGNYSRYLELRQQRLDTEEAQRSHDSNLYRRELEWMRRQPQARGTKARSRVESFHDLEERLRKRREEGAVHLDVQATYIGKKIFEVKGLSKSFGDKVILRDFNYLFARYEKMGIIGENGTGKSTFIKLLMGVVPPDGGVIDIGETVRFGYYAQEGLSFGEQDRVIDVVTALSEQIELSDGRHLSASQFLQMFLFSPQTQYNIVGKLSGGERRRLYLCTILMQNPNFLILDEPTNDLDIMTLQVLEAYLQSYGGCLIVISHDRYFMDKVVDHLLVFQGEGVVKDFPGNYSDFLEWQTLQEAEAHAAAAETRETLRKTETPAPRTALPEGKRKRSYKEKREMELLEQELAQLEQEKREIESLLSKGNLSVEELTSRSVRIGEVIEAIDQKSMRWLELSEIGE